MYWCISRRNFSTQITATLSSEEHFKFKHNVWKLKTIAVIVDFIQFATLSLNKTVLTLKVYSFGFFDILRFFETKLHFIEGPLFDFFLFLRRKTHFWTKNISVPFLAMCDLHRKKFIFENLFFHHLHL